MWRTLQRACSQVLGPRSHSFPNYISRPIAPFHTFRQELASLVHNRQFDEAILFFQNKVADKQVESASGLLYLNAVFATKPLPAALDSFRQLRPRLNRRTPLRLWSRAILECCRLAQPAEALAQLKEMLQNGEQGNVLLWNAVVHAYASNGDMENADLVFSMLLEQTQLQPSSMIYATLLKGHSYAGNAARLTALQADMNQRGIVLTTGETGGGAPAAQSCVKTPIPFTAEAQPPLEDASHFVLAFYSICKIDDPVAFVKQHKQYLSQLDALGRIYICDQGINGQMSISRADARRYMDWMHSDKRFENVEFKLHTLNRHAFAKLIVKHKPLVRFDAPFDPEDRGKHISPQEWRQLMDQRARGEASDTVLLDVRNKYEWDVGRFAGALQPECDTFREFQSFADKLKQSVDPTRTRVMMYCTGGIRCELFSSLLKKEGFDRILQLNGGVIKYGLEQGGTHWEGKLFVFDDRLVVPIAPDATSSISHCMHCGTTADSYFNCANAKCNELFIACPRCVKAHEGCCQQSCRHSPALRVRHAFEGNRPFRKWYSYLSQATSTKE